MHLVATTNKFIINLTILFILSFICFLPVKAQYEYESLRYAMLRQAGSSRFMSMGGALGALGSDFSCVSNNPAGIGLYRNSQGHFTPAIYLAQQNSSISDKDFQNEKFNFNFGSVGLIYSRRFRRNSLQGLQYLNFGIGYHRTNNFNHRFFAETTDQQQTLTDYFLSSAQGINVSNLDPFTTQLAFSTSLIDTTGSPFQYSGNGPLQSNQKLIRRFFQSNGSSGEIAMAAAANLSNRFFIGMNVSVSTLNYKSNDEYSETDQLQVNPLFHQFTYIQNRNVSGLGVNIKAGFIYKPVNWFRAGFAFHTPTWYAMTENKDNTLQTDLATGKFRADSPVGIFEYDLSTPWKWQTSLGFVIMKNTAIGIEYELMDYRGINLTDNSGMFNSSKPIIDSIYTLSHHIKFGSEVRIDPFRIRLGYQWQSNPYASITALNSSMHHFSGGIGFRTKKWFTFDAAYMLSVIDGKETFHQNLIDKIPFQLQSFLHHVSLSVGFNF